MSSGYTIKSYSELSFLKTFEERLDYLKLNGSVGIATFGFDRQFNQTFYRSAEWRRARDIVITRDCGCDLGIMGMKIYGRILIHHINPISLDDIRSGSIGLLNPENLICVSHETHNAIHYGNKRISEKDITAERSPGDTILWKKLGRRR